MGELLVQGLPIPSQLLGHLLFQRNLVHLFVRLEGEALHHMTPVVRLTVLQIRYQVVDIEAVLLEGATWRDEDVSDDLVDLDSSSDVAAFT